MTMIVFGALAVAIGVWQMFDCWWSVIEVLRGIIPIGIVFFGVIALAAGVSRQYDVKDNEGHKHIDA